VAECVFSRKEGKEGGREERRKEGRKEKETKKEDNNNQHDIYKNKRSSQVQRKTVLTQVQKESKLPVI
jgi:hypothetical protein